MTCIMTVLSVLSVFNGTAWNDIDVRTHSKIVTPQTEYVEAKVSIPSEDTILTKTVSVKCGESLEAKTNSILKTIK